MNRYLIFASLLLATLSCDKEPSSVPEPDGEDLISFSAQLPNGENTRVVAHNHENGGFVFSWENLDALGNWHSGCTTPQKFTNNAATGAEAAFGGKLGEGATHRFIFPYEEVTLDAKSTTYPIDISSQDGTLNKTYFVTQGSYTREQLTTGGVTLPMEHVGAFMIYDVTLESGDADKIYKLVEVKLSSETNAVPVRAEIDMTKDFNDDALYSSTTAGTISTQVDETFALDENSGKMKAIAKFNILPFEYGLDDSMTFEITVEVYEKGDNDEPTTLLERLTSVMIFSNIGDNKAQVIPFNRATHNTIGLTLSTASGVKITGATINDWEDTDNGTVYPGGEGLKASEISMDNIPEDLTWIITDTELDRDKTANLKNVLSSLGSGSKVTIVLPNATTIKDRAFFDMPHITTVYMPQVTTTEPSVFNSSKSLRSVYMPKVTTITENAFKETGFTSFDFTGITKIESFAFKGCTNLAEISNLSVATISDSAFKECCALSSFDFTGVTEIERGAFDGCTNLTEVSNISFTTIPIDAFKDCGLTSFDFTGITEIGLTSFYGCSNLAEVSNISFATIPDDAFCMSGLTSFDFTNITHIGNAAFGLCQNLKNVELPSTVVSIGNQTFAFSGCTTLTVHWSGETILTYDATWFSEAPLATINIPAGTTADYVTKGWPEALLVEQAQ